MATVTHRTRVRQSREETRERIIAAASLLLRKRSYAELTVDEVMREAGQGRTIFYRHFDDLADLLSRASREAIDALYEAQRTLGAGGGPGGADAVREAMGLAVAVYRDHGPLLRGIAEAAAGDEALASQHLAIRRRFDDLAEQWLRSSGTTADAAQTAHALNLMNEAYLLDAFGREPLVADEVAVRALTDIWLAVSRP